MSTTPLSPKDRIEELAASVVVGGKRINPLEAGAPAFKGEDKISSLLNSLRKTAGLENEDIGRRSLSRPGTDGIQGPAKGKETARTI